jgi:hypothetical protein
LVHRKRLSHAALLALPKLRVASSSLVARLEKDPELGASELEAWLVRNASL